MAVDGFSVQTCLPDHLHISHAPPCLSLVFATASLVGLFFFSLVLRSSLYITAVTVIGKVAVIGLGQQMYQAVFSELQFSDSALEGLSPEFEDSHQCLLALC